MGRVVGAAVVWVLVQTTICAADTPASVDEMPQPTVAPPEVNWYATTPPAAAAASPPAQRRVYVRRSGLFVLGGLSYVHEQPFARIDLGIPVSTRRASRLRAVAAIETRYATDSGAMAPANESDLDVTVLVQHDWRLPLDLRSGEVVLAIAAGLERAQHWERFADAPYWPSRWQSASAYSFDAQLAVQYRARSGLVVSWQMAGVSLALSQLEAPDPRWMTTERERWLSFAMLVGYQVR